MLNLIGETWVIFVAFLKTLSKTHILIEYGGVLLLTLHGCLFESGKLLLSYFEFLMSSKHADTFFDLSELGPN